MSVLPRASRALAVALLASLLAAPSAVARTSTSPSPSPTASATPTPGPVIVNPANPATPGNLTGYGFDQCNAPSQSAMDAWMAASPFLAAGIYISGNSRACKVQTNLTPTWVANQLARGWHLLPITLGPQASCSTRFPRYGPKIDPVIDASRTSTGAYANATAQGKLEADRALTAAAGLGIVPGSTLFYDLEAYDVSKKACKESALAFLSAWTVEIKAHRYLSGVYSSAGSGLKVLDQARAAGAAYAYPDQIWIADWNGRADTGSTYLSPSGWAIHQRVHQYQGGHNEKWAGVTINIDRNFLDVGRGSIASAETHCGGVPVDFASYPKLTPPATGAKVDVTLRPYVKALKCVMSERGGYTGRINAKLGKGAVAAITAWRGAHGASTTSAVWTKKLWITLFASGARQTIKYGSTGPSVRDLQRALLTTAQTPRPLAITGVLDSSTQAALVAYQKAHGLSYRGVAGTSTWTALGSGVR